MALCDALHTVQTRNKMLGITLHLTSLAAPLQVFICIRCPQAACEMPVRAAGEPGRPFSRNSDHLPLLILQPNC